jgi:hypothetical protein
MLRLAALDRSGKVDPAMRPLGVVVTDVPAEDLLEVAPGEDEDRSVHSARTVRTSRSATALARGDRTGVRMVATPSVARTSSNDLVNLESRSRTRYRTSSSSPPTAMFLACWVTQAESGCAVTPARCTFLDPISIKNSTYRVRSHAVSTVKKSQPRWPGPGSAGTPSRSDRHDGERARCRPGGGSFGSSWPRA